MNVDTGELRKLQDAAGGSEQDMVENLKRQMEELQKEASGWQAVPSELEPAAKKKLAGKDKAFVSLTSGGKLSEWAAKKRKEKRRMAALSKKKNRKK